jgi:protein-S-isoprenylcysteine O-methyltransferase Ste14
MTINFILRLITLALLIILHIYWFVHTKEAALKKPKTNNKSRIFEQIYSVLASVYVFINLLGFVIFPFKNIPIQVFGFILVILGFVEAVSARKTLDSNWTQSYEYQIKKEHELITKDIYKHVRHPIYGGILFMVNGALIVAGSYTFIIFFLVMLLVLESYALREEKLLAKHFGSKYVEYMKTTKKFIPFVY